MSVRQFNSSASFEKHGMQSPRRTGRLRGALIEYQLASPFAPAWCPIPRAVEIRKDASRSTLTSAAGKMKLASAVR
jgi:hypothetical protein